MEEDRRAGVPRRPHGLNAQQQPTWDRRPDVHATVRESRGALPTSARTEFSAARLPATGATLEEPRDAPPDKPRIRRAPSRRRSVAEIRRQEQSTRRQENSPHSRKPTPLRGWSPAAPTAQAGGDGGKGRRWRESYLWRR